MSKFKPRPPELRALPDLPSIDDLARFAAGAETRSFSVEPVEPEPVASEASEPSEATAQPAPAHVVARSAANDHVVARAAPAAANDERPWERFDKDARPHSGINLRLNSYEHELLKALAEDDERSLQQTIKRLLIPAAEAAAAQLRSR